MSDLTVGDKVKIKIEDLEHTFKVVELYPRHKLYVMEKVEVSRIPVVPK
jgi:sulfur relay (sulfurtransferase) DsrF/TusC family protein